MSGHTPGPWFTGHLCRDDHSCACPYIYSEAQPGMGAVATVGAEVGEDVNTIEEAKANQRLIAAAPELLHACRLIAQNAPRVRDWLSDNDPAALLQVLAAIDKATGP